MRNWILVMTIGCAGLQAAVQAAPESRKPGRPATLGAFAVQVSTALGSAPATQDAAVRDLRAFGVDLGADLGAPLTEGVAAQVMADLGYAVVWPENPSAPISESRAGVLAGAIAVGAVPQVPGAERIDVSAPLPPIVQCLQSPNLGQCSQCCVDLLPSRFPTGLGHQVCTRFCMFNQPPVSPSSPG